MLPKCAVPKWARQKNINCLAKSVSSNVSLHSRFCSKYVARQMALVKLGPRQYILVNFWSIYNWSKCATFFWCSPPNTSPQNGLVEKQGSSIVDCYHLQKSTWFLIASSPNNTCASPLWSSTDFKCPFRLGNMVSRQQSLFLCLPLFITNDLNSCTFPEPCWEPPSPLCASALAPTPHPGPVYTYPRPFSFRCPCGEFVPSTVSTSRPVIE